MPKTIVLATTLIPGFTETFARVLEKQETEINALQARKPDQTPETIIENLRKSLQLMKDFILQLANFIIDNTEDADTISWEEEPVAEPSDVVGVPTPPMLPMPSKMLRPGMQQLKPLQVGLNIESVRSKVHGISLNNIIVTIKGDNKRSIFQLLVDVLKENSVIDRAERSIIEFKVQLQAKNLDDKSYQELIKKAKAEKKLHEIINASRNMWSPNEVELELYLAEIKADLSVVGLVSWKKIVETIRQLIRPWQIGEMATAKNDIWTNALELKVITELQEILDARSEKINAAKIITHLKENITKFFIIIPENTEHASKIGQYKAAIERLEKIIQGAELSGRLAKNDTGLKASVETIVRNLQNQLGYLEERQADVMQGISRDIMKSTLHTEVTKQANEIDVKYIRTLEKANNRTKPVTTTNLHKPTKLIDRREVWLKERFLQLPNNVQASRKKRVGGASEKQGEELEKLLMQWITYEQYVNLVKNAVRYRDPAASDVEIAKRDKEIVDQIRQMVQCVKADYAIVEARSDLCSLIVQAVIQRIAGTQLKTSDLERLLDLAPGKQLVVWDEGIRAYKLCPCVKAESMATLLGCDLAEQRNIWFIKNMQQLHNLPNKRITQCLTVNEVKKLAQVINIAAFKELNVEHNNLMFQAISNWQAQLDSTHTDPTIDNLADVYCLSKLEHIIGRSIVSDSEPFKMELLQEVSAYDVAVKKQTQEQASKNPSTPKKQTLATTPIKPVHNLGINTPIGIPSGLSFSASKGRVSTVFGTPTRQVTSRVLSSEGKIQSSTTSMRSELPITPSKAASLMVLKEAGRTVAKVKQEAEEIKKQLAAAEKEAASREQNEAKLREEKARLEAKEAVRQQMAMAVVPVIDVHIQKLQQFFSAGKYVELFKECSTNDERLSFYRQMGQGNKNLVKCTLIKTYSIERQKL